MKIYKNRTFDRWARKEGLNNLSLCNAVNEMAAGLYDADLGGGLFKKRIAKPGKGKSGGFRTLVATNPSCGLSNTNLLFQAIAHGELAMAHSATATSTQAKV